jgi:hypothetical protein
MRLLIVVVLVVLLIVLWPTWRHPDERWGRPWHRNYDYYPSTLLGVVLVVAVILILFGYL